MPVQETIDGYSESALSGKKWLCLVCTTDLPSKQPRRREESNDDQEVRLRKWLDDHWDGEVNTVVIAGTGSGERVDRPEYLEAMSAVESGQYD
jgi:hypothetical protein